MHILKLNDKMREGCKWHDTHMHHITLVKDYATHINKMLGNPVNRHKLGFAALAHDTLKENYNEKTQVIDGINIPGSIKEYVCSHIDIITKYVPEEYLYTDLQFHATGATIFLEKEMGITDPEILYPVLFHSLPVIEVYQNLDPKIQTMIDIMVLSDKLSSNWLRINKMDEEVRCDLDHIVFGPNGNEFNYVLGIYAARLIGAGKKPDYVNDTCTIHYFHRLHTQNPLVNMKIRRNVLGKKRKFAPHIPTCYK
jgi:hypothetical protein